MELFFYILAALGFAAVLRYLLRSAFRAARYSAYMLYAREIAATRARRGDLTGLEEARGWGGIARREWLQAVGGAGFWLGLLIVPATILPRAVPFYAAYVVIWLVPLRRPRRQRTEG
jgi:hypothetical protein